MDFLSLIAHYRRDDKEFCPQKEQNSDETRVRRNETAETWRRANVAA
jgi:hypothetical protein